MRKYAPWVMLCLVAAPVTAKEERASVLPTDLNAVPRSAALFLHVRAEELWKSDLMKDARLLFEKAGDKRVKQLVESIVPDLSTIDRVTIILNATRGAGSVVYPFPRNNPDARSVLYVLHTNVPFDRVEIRKAYADHEKFHQRRMYYFIEDLWSGLLFLDDQTLIFGNEDSLIDWMDMRAKNQGAGPLQGLLEQAARGPSFTLGIHPPTLFRDAPDGAIPPNFTPLTEAKSVAFTADINKGVELELAFQFDKEDKAKNGAKALRDLLELGRTALNEPKTFLEEQMDRCAAEKPAQLDHVLERAAMVGTLGFLNLIDETLKNQKIEVVGTRVSSKLEMRWAGAENLLMLAFGAVGTMGTSRSKIFAEVAGQIGGEMQDPFAEHLKIISAALEKYQKDKGCYPPTAIRDEHGRALLSWRVALLPYLGEEDLYKEFNLNEPWDSMHNKRLIKKIPQALRNPGRNDYDWEEWSPFSGPNRLVGQTQDLLVAGPGTAFEGKLGIKKDEVDPKAVLLVLTDRRQKTYWTKPMDLVFQPDGGDPVVFRNRRDSVPAKATHLLLSDGSVEKVESVEAIDWKKWLPRKKK